MPTIDTLVGGPRRSGILSQIVRGIVVRAPANPEEAMRVSVVNYSATADYEVPAAQWMPRGVSVPVVGDTCLVIFDDEGDAWVPAWG